MKFALAGHLTMTHEDLKDYILSHGGSFSETVASDVCSFAHFSKIQVDYLISTYPEVLLERPKIRAARYIDLAIVCEMLLERLTLEFGFDQTPYLLAGNVVFN